MTLHWRQAGHDLDHPPATLADVLAADGLVVEVRLLPALDPWSTGARTPTAA